MTPRFREDKTTEAAAFLLKMRGGSMSYMKLIKLLYLADREALIRWGRPITFDSYVSMKNGPVLSATLNLINEGSQSDSEWTKNISTPQEYSVSMITDPGINTLSEAEVLLLKEIFARYGSMNRWALVENVMHNLGEWRNPGPSTYTISYQDILKASGKTENEIDSITGDLDAIAFADAVLG